MIPDVQYCPVQPAARARPAQMRGRGGAGGLSVDLAAVLSGGGEEGGEERGARQSYYSVLERLSKEGPARPPDPAPTTQLKKVGFKHKRFTNFINQFWY